MSLWMRLQGWQWRRDITSWGQCQIGSSQSPGWHLIFNPIGYPLGGVILFLSRWTTYKLQYWILHVYQILVLWHTISIISIEVIPVQVYVDEAQHNNPLTLSRFIGTLLWIQKNVIDIHLNATLPSLLMTAIWIIVSAVVALLECGGSRAKADLKLSWRNNCIVIELNVPQAGHCKWPYYWHVLP